MNTVNDPLDPLDALKSELASVSVSPDFPARVLAAIEATPLDALRDELAAVSVSPEFAVRVRQQIESAASRPRWFAFLDWRWAVPVAAAAVIGVIAISRGVAPATPTVTSSGVQASTGESASPRAPRVPETPSIAVRGMPSPAQRTAATTAASVLQADDKLEVITQQQELFRQLWAAAAPAGVVDVAALPDEVRDVVIAPLEVGSVVVKWMVEPPTPSGASGGSVPEIRRIAAYAERSAR